ncbi:MAG: homoserine dehydrogenase [Candidatus Lokiarchaeota archaeon]|nr:homoserine dehydrogenase [Candidatus Lokiarchaeota archaeon]MBD3202489.1 homoserine dehydrogenase [Candidatus Lokiarchaeota archaeon]
MKVKICLIGKGTVGKCFLELLNKKLPIFKHKFDIDIVIVGIFEIDGGLVNKSGLNIRKVIEMDKDFRKLNDWKFNINPLDLISKIDVDICIETTPTNPETGEPALSHIKAAIKNGIHIIASNKGPFYLKYKEIKELANKNACLIQYEATVASGVPILSIKKSLGASKIKAIRAILNGTSNYILSRMASEGIDFSIALKEAQELGYAEADPTLDIEGYDAAGKLVILANELLGWSKSIQDVKIRGISKITPQAIELAKSDGYIIKHLAIAENNSLIVEPRLIENYSALNISGTLNVIELKTEYMGSIVLMGRGAGGYEAASAILNDLFYICDFLKKDDNI